MTENPYSKLDENGVKEQIALFKEALEGKKDIDLYTEFALEKPIEITDDEKARITALEATDAKFSEIATLIGVQDSKNTVSEPTAHEKELSDRQEKLEQVAFNDKVSEIKSINSEFNPEKIEALEISTSDKVVLMGTVKDIVQTYQSGYDKLKTELSSKDAKVKDTKLSSKSQDESVTTTDAEPGAGKSIVAKFSNVYGLKTETKKDTE